MRVNLRRSSAPGGEGELGGARGGALLLPMVEDVARQASQIKGPPAPHLPLHLLLPLLLLQEHGGAALQAAEADEVRHHLLHGLRDGDGGHDRGDRPHHLHLPLCPNHLLLPLNLMPLSMKYTF